MVNYKETEEFSGSSDIKYYFIQVICGANNWYQLLAQKCLYLTDNNHLTNSFNIGFFCIC